MVYITATALGIVLIMFYCCAAVIPPTSPIFVPIPERTKMDPDDFTVCKHDYFERTIQQQETVIPQSYKDSLDRTTRLYSDWEPIRIVLDFSMLEAGADSAACQAAGDSVPMDSGPNWDCTSEDVITDTKRDLIKVFPSLFFVESLNININRIL